jgi:regulator of replication initiation timing
MKTSSSSKTFARLTPAHAASHSKSRSITEKLRSNHIDLLEYAERLTVENTKLRGRLCEILKLSENCDDATTDLLLGLSNPSESSDNEASNAGSLFEPQIKELREQVEALQSQLRKLEAENKTLRAKASIQRPPASAEKNDGAVLAIDDSTREGELQDSEKNENNRAGASKIKVSFPKGVL